MAEYVAHIMLFRLIIKSAASVLIPERLMKMSALAVLTTDDDAKVVEALKE